MISAAAAAYQALAIAAALAHRRKASQCVPAVVTPVSVLKPVRGIEPGLEEAVRANASQSYPDFEVLFGVEPGDPAEAVIQRISREFPPGRIGLVRVSTRTPNRKVGALIDLAQQAMGDVIVVADADVIPPPLYLRRVVGLLADASAGLVTCVYPRDGVPGRDASRRWASRPILLQAPWRRPGWGWMSSPSGRQWRCGAPISSASADSNRSKIIWPTITSSAVASGGWGCAASYQTSSSRHR